MSIAKICPEGLLKGSLAGKVSSASIRVSWPCPHVASIPKPPFGTICFQILWVKVVSNIAISLIERAYFSTLGASCERKIGVLAQLVRAPR